MLDIFHDHPVGIVDGDKIGHRLANSLQPLVRNAILAAASEEAMEEERRLMYVACTRAKENLFITYPINIYDRESGMLLSKPSRFIEGMPEQLLDTWVVDEE